MCFRNYILYCVKKKNSVFTYFLLQASEKQSENIKADQHHIPDKQVIFYNDIWYKLNIGATHHIQKKVPKSLEPTAAK